MTPRKGKPFARALSVGRSLADEALDETAKERRARAHVLRSKRFAAAAKRPPLAIPAKTAALLSKPPGAGILLAEGDSWFNYPSNDVLRCLEREHGYDVESVAHKGDRVEDMAYSKGQFADFARSLEKLLAGGKVPRAILLSGGGNDIAGDEFAIMFNHVLSSLPRANDDIMRGVIDVRLRAAYTSIIGGITRICEHYLEQPIRIITHGYGRPVPDGRGYHGGWWFLPGPWLKPGFDAKGYERPESTGLVGDLIDRFNAMVRDVSLSAGFSHVRYIDLRDLLPNDKRYKTFWDNELHPTEHGFRLVAAEFAKAVAAP